MAVEIRAIEPTKSNLRKFVKFGISLYKDNPYYVPPLIFDDVNTLLPSKNPAFEHCEAQSFMAYRDGKPVGRITALVNHLLNERTGKKEARFGFLELIDDEEVADALFKAAEDWARSKGMTEIIGPMGFTDMDHEAMLVEGFEEMGTMATIYNHPYYPEHVERLGYVKDADWIEFRMPVPDKLPDKMARVADMVQRRFGLRFIKYTSSKKIKEDYGVALFELINEAYADLYGYSPLTPRQIQYYIDMYLGIIRLEYVSVIVDKDDKLVGVGISMPSLTKALQKSKGRLFPFGWYHLLRAIKGKNDVVDLMLVAVKPEYQNKGVNALLFADLLPLYIKNGVKFAESNLELEDNTNVQSQWQYFERRQHRRRRVFRKKL
ncbi:MAG: N-acetyltransferase [Muribaculaceae bacterium]|nr:N-acetyltransferase [Muribaculaceae bacterium]